MINTNKVPRKPETFKYYGTKDNPYILGGISRDYWRGHKDGKIAPAACKSALDGIEAAEMRYKEETRNGIRQAKEEANTVIANCDDLLNANKIKQDSMKESNTLVSEPVANADYKAALTEYVVATLLMMFEIYGLADIGKDVFGKGFISALVIAFLISLTSALLVKYFLKNVSNNLKAKTRIILSSGGFLFMITGLLGFVILRSETFNSGLTGGSFNFNHIWWGNLLLMIGLTLGIPCVSGALYEDASERLKLSKSSRDLYNEKSMLTEIRKGWTIQLKKLEEFDKQIDDVTKHEISFRKNRYARGFHIGGRKNPDAKTEIRGVMLTNQ